MLSSFRNFWIAFIIAAILFATAGYFITVFLEDTMDAILSPADNLESIIAQVGTESSINVPQTTSTPVDDPTQVPINGSSFTLLLCVSDYEPERYSDYLPNESYAYEDLQMKYGMNPSMTFLKNYRYPTLSSIVVIHCDKENQRFVMLPISSMMKEETSAFVMTLGRTYQFFDPAEDPFGVSYLQSRVHMLTGWEVTDTIHLNITEIPQFLEQFGTFSVTLPCSVYTDGEDYFTILPTDATYEEGKEPVLYLPKDVELILTPEQARPLFLLKERYEKDVKNKLDILDALFTAMMNKLMSSPTEEIASFFVGITGENVVSGEELPIEGVKLVDTDVTLERLAEQMDLLMKFAEYDVLHFTIPSTMTCNLDATLQYVVPQMNEAHALLFPYRVQ